MFPFMSKKVVEEYVDVQITAVEVLAGRQNTYVRTYGYRKDDLSQSIIQMHLEPRDAAWIIEAADRDKCFPVVEVPRKRFTVVLNAGEVKVVSIQVQL